MNNRDNTFLQKLKDNAFYLSLVLGLFAILAVVGVYTAGQQDKKVADNEMDLNVASDYASVTTEESDDVENVDASVSKEKLDSNEQEKAVEAEEDLHNTSEEDTDVASIHKNATEENTSESEEDTTEALVQESVPVTVNAGELDFNSEKTVDWPINGKVILPYSMETTVYFKTLDQYKCNPGMLIQAGVGTTVQNAYLGQVTDVTSDNTYGNVVTLYIGNGYSLVYGQLDTIYVKEGDFVKAGQSIGTVGKPTDSFVEEGCHLFFQMLKEDDTVDPAMFIE